MVCLFFFFGLEKGTCYDMLLPANSLLERVDCNLSLLGMRTRKNQGGRMEGEPA